MWAHRRSQEKLNYLSLRFLRPCTNNANTKPINICPAFMPVVCPCNYEKILKMMSALVFSHVQSGAPPRNFAWGEGWIQVRQAHHPQILIFLGFRALHFENIRKSKKCMYSENFIQKTWFLGDVPQTFETAGRVPHDLSDGANASNYLELKNATTLDQETKKQWTTKQTWVRLTFNSVSESFDWTQLMTHNAFARINSNQHTIQNRFLKFDSIRPWLKELPEFLFKSTHD